jgi:predicted nucleic acid-binding protein
MVFVQGALRNRGPAYECLRLGEERAVILLVSRTTLDELREVLSRPSLREKSQNLTDESVARFLSEVDSFSETVPEPPKAFPLPRDPKDEIYTDLAIGSWVRSTYATTPGGLCPSWPQQLEIRGAFGAILTHHLQSKVVRSTSSVGTNAT